METADQLILRAVAFGNEHPKHHDFAKRLIELVQKISRDFDGETRDSLIVEARSAFDRHLQIVTSTAETMRALEKLKQQQVRLAEALNELQIVRPPDATLH